MSAWPPETVVELTLWPTEGADRSPVTVRLTLEEYERFLAENTDSVRPLAEKDWL